MLDDECSSTIDHQRIGTQMFIINRAERKHTARPRGQTGKSRQSEDREK